MGENAIKHEKKFVTLDDAIHAALQWDADRYCTPERMARVLNGFCDKLSAHKLATSYEVEEMRKRLLSGIPV